MDAVSHGGDGRGSASDDARAATRAEQALGRLLADLANGAPSIVKREAKGRVHVDTWRLWSSVPAVPFSRLYWSSQRGLHVGATERERLAADHPGRRGSIFAPSRAPGLLSITAATLAYNTLPKEWDRWNGIISLGVWLLAYRVLRTAVLAWVSSSGRSTWHPGGTPLAHAIPDPVTRRAMVERIAEDITRGRGDSEWYRGEYRDKQRQLHRRAYEQGNL